MASELIGFSGGHWNKLSKVVEAVGQWVSCWSGCIFNRSVGISLEILATQIKSNALSIVSRNR